MVNSLQDAAEFKSGHLALFHGEMEQKEKKLNLNLWLTRQCKLIVGTIAVSTGINNHHCNVIGFFIFF